MSRCPPVLQLQQINHMRLDATRSVNESEAAVKSLTNEKERLVHDKQTTHSNRSDYKAKREMAFQPVKNKLELEKQAKIEAFKVQLESEISLSWMLIKKKRNSGSQASTRTWRNGTMT